jgi:hypothetical protein
MTLIIEGNIGIILRIKINIAMKETEKVILILSAKGFWNFKIDFLK